MDVDTAYDAWAEASDDVERLEEIIKTVNRLLVPARKREKEASAILTRANAENDKLTQN